MRRQRACVPAPRTSPGLWRSPCKSPALPWKPRPDSSSETRKGKECYLQRHESSLQCLLSSDISLLLPEAASAFVIHFKAIVRNAECIPHPHSHTHNHPLTVLVVESEFLFFQLDRSVLPLLSCEPLWSQGDK